MKGKDRSGVRATHDNTPRMTETRPFWIEFFLYWRCFLIISDCRNADPKADIVIEVSRNIGKSPLISNDKSSNVLCVGIGESGGTISMSCKPSLTCKECSTLLVDLDINSAV